MVSKPFIRKLLRYEDRLALSQGGHSHRYADLHARVVQQLNCIRNAGIASGEVVFLQGDYSLEAIALFLALYLNGNIVALSSATHVREHEGKLAISCAHYFVDSASGSIERNARTPDAESALVRSHAQTGRAGLILFSSGSTGKPKGMLHDLDTLIDSYVDRKPRSENILIFMLFDHIGGIDTLLNALSAGNTVTIPAHKTPEHVADLIATFRVTVLPTTPSFLNFMLMSGVIDRYDLSSLTLITYGAETMPESVLRRIREKLPTVKLLQTFGTSETGAVKTSSRSSDSLLMKFNDPAIRYKVVHGELWLQSERLILGYLNHDRDAFAEDGWFRTGDLVEEDPEGFLRVKGRLAEVINVAGQKVFPAEVESVLLDGPLVQDCKVFGEAHSLIGHAVAAEVVLYPDCRVDHRIATRNIRAHARANLDAYKVPIRITVVDRIAYSARAKKMLRNT